MRIPKVIHQVWHSWKSENSNPPQQHQIWTQKLLELHPGWSYKLWREADCEKLLTDHYPLYLELYRSYDKNVKRVDMIKYFILHHEGGMVMNTGFMPLRNIEALLGGVDVLLGEQYDKEYFSIANGLMASIPKHAIWDLAINKLEAVKAEHVLKATGPAFLTNLVEEYSQREGAKDIRVLHRNFLYPFSWNKDDLSSNSVKECLKEVELCNKHFADAHFIYVWPGSWLDQY
jgi:mannosyltransferase OCH1-like enzyme